MLLNSLEEAIGARFEKNVTIGAEMEIYVIDAYENEYKLLDDSIVLENIYGEFDERVYRDYYEYQLEIRTNPSDDWKEVANELIELMKEVSRAAKEQQCFIAPVSYIHGGMFNGFHVHVGFEPAISFGKMVEHAFAMYPFMFDICRITLSAPCENEKWGRVLSLRQLESPHIGVPPLGFDNADLEYYWIHSDNARGENRYHDIIINTNKKEGRHRLKDTNTIEVRMFDCVGSRKAIKCVIESAWKIAKFMNPEWFEKFRRNSGLMTKIERLIRNSRLALVKSYQWVNPLTLTTTAELLDWLEVENWILDSWVVNAWYDYDKITNPDFHASISYPLA